MKCIVPETADLRLIVLVVEAIREGVLPHESCGISEHQASYALQAALARSAWAQESGVSSNACRAWASCCAIWHSSGKAPSLEGGWRHGPREERGPQLAPAKPFRRAAERAVASTPTHATGTL